MNPYLRLIKAFETDQSVMFDSNEVYSLVGFIDGLEKEIKDLKKEQSEELTKNHNRAKEQTELMLKAVLEGCFVNAKKEG